MQYRPEIDGLRAIAVVPVILFHAGFPVFSGGYIGVDVFFVISGYLITTILLDEHRRGTFSLLNFYERRARRILPALFLVMLCCIPAAILWMPTKPFDDFSRSMVFASLFASNIHFMEKAGGYFSLRSELQPLLHTWSLAVEEQFYLIFPLLLGFLVKWRLRVVVIGLAVIAVLSLGLSEWGSRNFRDANFFFTFSRFWELLAGSFCAVALFDRQVKERGWLAALGLAMIVGSVFLYGPGVPFPSTYSLLPVLGTVAVILFAAQSSFSGRVLSSAPVVGIGLISYSAYLWHQPLFAFARLRSMEEPSTLLMLGLAVAAFGLAILSWRFVERPFRKPATGLLRQRGFIFASSGVFATGLAAFGLYGMNTGGMPGRLLAFQATDVGAALTSLQVQPKYHDCSNHALPTDPGALYCTAFAPDQAKGTIAVIGDSHAESLLPAFEALASEWPARVVVGTKSACPPLLGVYTSRSAGSVTRCHNFARDLAEQLLVEDTLAVFLVAKWSIYTGAGLHVGNPRLLLRRAQGDAWGDHDLSREVFEEGLDTTIAFYRDAGIPVFLVQQVPETRLSPGYLLEKLALGRTDAQDVARIIGASYVTTHDMEAAHRYASRVLAGHEGEGVHLLSLNAPFVVDDRYKWFSDARSLYLDTSHLSLDGAQFLRDHLRQQAMELMAGQAVD